VVRGADGEYAVYDTKLARSARASAVLQVAAYAEAFRELGVPMSRYGYLVLGSGEVTRHSVVDTAPVYRRLRARYETLIGSRFREELAQWGAIERGGSGLASCGRCDECERHLADARDVLLVMGCSTAHRARLNAAGIHTVEELAALAPVDDSGVVRLARADLERVGLELPVSATTKLVAQAQLFLEGEAHGADVYRVVDTKPFGLLHPISPDDIFFDFEGDPLYAEAGSSDWGIEYLFGWCTRYRSDGEHLDFHALWAHDRREEKRAFERFIDYLTERAALGTNMHVYHYAPYETAALKRLALRHGTREEELDQLLRRGLFVDLYSVVRGALRTSGRSLSIKKLEPFYIDALGEAREGVTNAADSITEYATAMQLRASGDLGGFARRLAEIEDYNRYDCESTYHLLNWIGDIAERHGVHWRQAPHVESLVEVEEALDSEETEATRVGARLREHVDRLTERWHHEIAEAEAHGRPESPEPEARMIARMAWAAIDYNKRENKQFWWAHFARLSDPVEDWSGSDVFRPTRVHVLEDWHVPPKARTQQRIVQMYGELEPGNKLRSGTSAYAIYDEPVPLPLSKSANGIRGWGGASISDVEEVPGEPGHALITLVEKTARTNETWSSVPLGLGPGAPISTKIIDERLLDFGREILAALDANPDEPSFSDSAQVHLLCREGTAVRMPESEAREGLERIDNILASLTSIDSGVVAVQGPPGAGKTFVASHVITTLAKKHGWNIGVVAQSHAVVENVLSAVVARGMNPEAIGKRPSSTHSKDSEWPYQPIDAKNAAAFFAEAHTGTVTGGTAWTYSSPDFSPAEGYDLIVIDEAGQYSMANSLAVTHAAQRVLLLGDPQQLPQVSQGVHPEPVDESALAWLVGDDPTIAEDRGFFLDETWRMHPNLTRAVSELSYEGKLHSVKVTEQRHLEGSEPGLHTVLVNHRGNTVSAPEEAAEIIARMRELVGKEWREDSATRPRPLEPSDFIVVAPFNAQVQLLRERLNVEGFEDTSVGTVDKFQGREAPVAFVSLAVSDAESAPRGLEFVRNRNRLNVSISRGQHSAYLIHSAALLDALETHPKGIEEHGAFIRLSEAGL
jgi:uncharacterized protein